MRYRALGRTGWDISEVGFGAWAIGGRWGTPDDEQSMAALHRALDAGVNFFDTADVYGDGRSERLLARLRRERREPFYIATRPDAGCPARRPPATTRPTSPRSSSAASSTWKPTRSTCVQLHCPPTDVYCRPEVFEAPGRTRRGRQAAVLRRQRRARGGGVEGDRVSGRAVGADHLQHLPPAASSMLFFARGGARKRSASSRGCRCPPAC